MSSVRTLSKPKAVSTEERPFPLYDEIVERIRNSPAQSIDLRRVCSTINSIHQHIEKQDEAQEILDTIFALCFHHELVENRGVMFRSTPYSGKVLEGGKGVLYTVTNLPPFLQQIIATFILMVAEE